MKKKAVILSYFTSSIFLWISPRLAYAAPFKIEIDEATGCAINASNVLSLGCLSQIVINIVNLALQFLGVVAILFFLFGAFKFVTSGGDSKAIDAGRNTMVYSVIGAAFVICSFLIVGILTGTFTFLPIDVTKFTLYQK